MGLDLTATGVRVFLAVVDTGSFTAAAERLGYTQSAVSKQIHTLERAAGAALFARGARGVEPTQAGTLLARRCALISDQLEMAEAELRELSTPVAGRVALGGFATTAIRLVPQTIRRLGIDRPGIVVDFQESSTPTQIRKLRSGRLDLAVIAVGEGLPVYDIHGITTEQLPAGPLLVAVPKHHPFAAADRVTVEDLRQERWIAGTGARGDPQFGPWPGLVAPHVVARISDWTMRFGFVAAGLGITTIPSLAAQALPGDVTAVEVEDPGRQIRQLLMAWVGLLSPAAVAVQASLRHEASVIAAGAGRRTPNI